MIKTDSSIYQISIDKIDICIFDYIKIAIMICIRSNNEDQLVLKYLPEIVNYFYKIQLASISFYAFAIVIPNSIHSEELSSGSY